MYSGFITSKRVLSAVGVHQRFDRAAYRMISPFLADNSFPSKLQLKHFEGANGPDGLKVKSPGKHEPGHLYNPETGAGDIPRLVEDHYHNLVIKLRQRDLVRAAFDASWMAHYICDGLTPAHHFPLEQQLAVHKEGAVKTSRHKHSMIVPGDNTVDTVKRSWAVWGGKGLLSTHLNFEMGVATTLLGHRLRVSLNHAKLAKARSLGLLNFFQGEAKEISALGMYEIFYEHGWTAELGRLVKRRLAPQTIQTIGIAWLLAYLEAGLDAVKVEQIAIRSGED